MMRGGSGGRADDLATDLRALRILGGALMVGPAALIGVVLYLHAHRAQPLTEQEARGVVTWTALALALVVVVISLLLPRPKGGDIGQIRGHLIMRLALVEGGSLFGSVAYLLEGERVGLGVAVLCLAVMALAHFPTRERVERLLAERP